MYKVKGQLKQMKKFRQIMKIIISIAVIFGAYLGGVYYTKYSQNVKENKSTITTIAVVNTDVGTTTNGNYKNYATELIQFPDTNFEMAGLNEAREGITSNKYAAYIVIPSNFSEAVESVNWKPEKSEITYQINSSLREDVQTKIVADIHNFIVNLSANVSYIYVDAILKEIHNVQNDSNAIMQNDIKDMKAITDVQTDELIDEVNYEPLLVTDTKIEHLDLKDSYTKLDDTVDAVCETYKTNMQKAEEDFKTIKGNSVHVTEQAVATESVFSNVDIIRDDEGNVVYEEGMQELNNIASNIQEEIGPKKKQAKERMGFCDGDIDPLPEPELGEGEIRTYLSKSDLQEKIDEQIKIIEEQKEVMENFPEELQQVLDSLYLLKEDINNYYENQIRAINEIPDGSQLLGQAQDIIDKKIQKPIEEEIEKESGNVGDALTMMTTALDTYLCDVEKYDALSYIEQEKIAQYMSSIYNIIDVMESDIINHDNQYMEYIFEVEETTDTNIEMLQNNLDQSYEQTKANINNTMEVFKTNRTVLNEQNVEMLQDITQKLPYTRLGNLEYTQVYDLIAQPVIINDDAIKNKKFTSTMVVIDWTDLVCLAVGIIALVIIDISVQIIYKKRKHELKCRKEDELWQVE